MSAVETLPPAVSTQRPLNMRVVLAASSDELLARGRARAGEQGLSYAGSLYPPEAWALLEAGTVRLVDVRTAEELKFVGQVPDALHVPWQIGPAMLGNPHFLDELARRAGQDPALVLLCRSGKRSAAAATAATAAGFSQVYSVLEGFEGDLDVQQQRGERGGWRLWGLPWVQD